MVCIWLASPLNPAGVFSPGHWSCASPHKQGFIGLSFTPGNISQLEPSAVSPCAGKRLSLDFSLGGWGLGGGYLSFSCGHYAPRPPEYVCARDCLIRSTLSAQVPELPSDTTRGLCFDPLASRPPKPPIRHIVHYMCQLVRARRTTGDAQCPLKLFFFFCSKFALASAFIPAENFSPAHSPMYAVRGSSRRTTRLGSPPCTLCHLKSQRYILLFSKAQGFFFLPIFIFFFHFSSKAPETVALAALLWIRRWESSAGFSSRGLEKFEMNDAWFGMLEVIQE